MVDKPPGKLAKVEIEDDPAFQALKSFLLSEDVQRRYEPGLARLTEDIGIAADRLTGLLADDNISVIRVLGGPGAGKTHLMNTALKRLDPARYNLIVLSAAQHSDLEALDDLAPAAGVREPNTILVLDDVDSIMTERKRWHSLEQLAKGRSFGKLVLMGRASKSLEDVVGTEGHATVRLGPTDSRFRG